MSSSDLRAALDVLLAADIDAADGDELASVVAAAAAMRSWLDACDVRCARRGRRLADEQSAAPPESVLGTAGRLSGKAAEAVIERDRVCSAAASFEEALAAGTVSSGHVDAMAKATSRLPDDLRDEFFSHQDALLRAAESERVDAFGRQCRDLSRHLVASSVRSDVDELESQRTRSTVKRWIDTSTGMHHTHLELDPVRDAKLWTAVDARLATARRVDGNVRTPWAQLKVDAFVDSVGAGSDSVARIPEIVVLIDQRTLTSGWHGHSICETDDGVAIPVDTVRRMCCDAEIGGVTVGARGEALDAGRTIRTANRAQRRALRAMHRTCVDPDCTVGFSACKIHHVRWWSQGGPTDVDNLVPLCERHHHLVHDGGWTLTMTADRIATWTRPDGTVHHVGSTIDRVPSEISTVPTVGAAAVSVPSETGAPAAPRGSGSPGRISSARPRNGGRHVSPV